MSKKATFTNEQLVTVWREVAESNGTRKDVVAKLNLDPVKGYNNVTQRVKALSKAGLQFQSLKSGARGGVKRNNEELSRLASILGTAVATTEVASV